jgi:hypothetical protein
MEPSTMMLAELKAKDEDFPSVNDNVAAPSAASVAAIESAKMPAVDDDILSPQEKNDAQVTCDVLCSLSTVSPQPALAASECAELSLDCGMPGEKRKAKTCPKQHQLPMFLSKTYHMIDRCDPTIATWSTTGDNFVVKNVEKFATNVLPLYFKHSNFSSFARQLNFYGFRKLRTDPILTSDVDPRTACYVRFYHDKFQKDRPELLHQIKRATKSDQQSKDEVESLKAEVSKLKDFIGQMNHRINTLSTEYDKLMTLITEILTRQQQGQPQQQQQQQLNPSQQAANAPDLMHSLSQVAAMSLQNQLRPLSSEATAAIESVTGVKRQIPETAEQPPSPSRQRTS